MRRLLPVAAMVVLLLAAGAANAQAKSRASGGGGVTPATGGGTTNAISVWTGGATLGNTTLTWTTSGGVDVVTATGTAKAYIFQAANNLNGSAYPFVFKTSTAATGSNMFVDWNINGTTVFDLDKNGSVHARNNVKADTSFQFSDGSALFTVPLKYGAYSSRPSANANNTGRIYICSDCPNALHVDQGGTWAPIVGGQVVGTQPKAAASFTLFTRSSPSASAALTDRNGTLHLSWANDGTTQNSQGFFESATTSVTAIVNMSELRLRVQAGSYMNAGVGMRESATGKFYDLVISYWNDSSGAGMQQRFLEYAYWASPTSRTASAAYILPESGDIILRVRVSGANVLSEYSVDGQNFIQVNSTAKTTAFTTAPDQAIIVAQQWATSGDNVEADILSYASQ